MQRPNRGLTQTQKAATEAEAAVKAEEKAEADATAAKEQARAKAATKKTQAEEKAKQKADADAKAATEAEDAKAKEKADNEKDTADAKEKAEATAAKEKMAATKAAKEKEKADAEEKLQKEEAAERNRALDNEAMKQSALENMKAGTKHVGSNIYIPKVAVHFKDGGVSALFVQSNGDEGSLVHGPFKTSPAAGTIGVHVTVQFEKPVTVARSICESSSLPAGYWAKEQQAPLCDNKSSLQCSLGDCSWWEQGVCASQKTPVVVDALENAPVNIRSGNFCVQLMIWPGATSSKRMTRNKRRPTLTIFLT